MFVFSFKLLLESLMPPKRGIGSSRVQAYIGVEDVCELRAVYRLKPQ